MKNVDAEIIYIGKAKDIRKRVSSYFSKSIKDPKTQVLVKHINEIDYIVTDSELEALILECNLIKEKKPRYNIDLKDNKSYPFIKVTLNETYPRIFKTRKFKRDASRYFGPYPNVQLIYRNLKLIHQLFPIRSCDLDLPSKRKNIDPCLDYFIKRCDGCCINKITPEKYKEYIDEVILFLGGKYGKLIKLLNEKMMEASKELKYEIAAKIKNQIEAVKEINEKQRVYSTEDLDIDVLGFYLKERIIILSLLFIREGKLLGKRIFVLKEDDIYDYFSPEWIISYTLKNYYSNDHEIPDEIILPIIPLEKDLLMNYISKLKNEKVKITVPKGGRKLEWVTLASQNAQFGYMEEKKVTGKELILSELKLVLNLSVEPRRIEGFDIANTDGHNAVASMVSFLNGIADKKNYRYYKIRTIEGPNDVGMIKEVIARRYQKLKNESLALPDLILIDGGKGQLNGAKEVIDTLGLNIPVISLAKREEEIFIPGNKVPIKLADNSQCLRLLQTVRDEAHRFGNSFHKKLRDKKTVKSIFDEIKGVGKQRKTSLMKHFKTLNNIKQASLQELYEVECLDKPTAKRIYEFFH